MSQELYAHLLLIGSILINELLRALCKLLLKSLKEVSRLYMCAPYIYFSEFSCMAVTSSRHTHYFINGDLHW